MQMTAHFDRSLVEAEGLSSRYLVARITVPVSSRRVRRPVNLALVLDRSGSMGGEKMAATLKAADHALALLREGDHFALVIYDNEVDVLLEHGPASAARLARAGQLLRMVRARAQTALFDGWLAGCREVARGPLAEAVSRVLLLTDGLANHGETDPGVITRHAAELRERGVNTSTLGFGADFNEFLLAGMADAGGGHFHFVEGPADIGRVMQQEMGDSLEVVAREVRLVVEAPVGVRLQSLNAFAVQADGSSIALRLGDLNEGQSLACAFIVEAPAGPVGTSLDLALRLLDGSGQGLASAAAALHYAAAAEVEQQPSDADTLREALDLRAALARREAYTYNADQRFDQASGSLHHIAAEYRETARRSGLAEFDEVAAELMAESEFVAARMDAFERKRRYSSTVHRAKSRSPMGRAQAPVPSGALVLLCTRTRQMEVARHAVEALQPVLRSLTGLPAIVAYGEVFRVLPWQRTERLGPEEETDIARTARTWAPTAGARLVLTELGFEDNWFSHWHRRSATRITSLAGVVEQAGIEPSAFIAYELLMAMLYLLSPVHDELQLAHREVRACLFDFCGDRRDLAVKLQNMDLCPVCEQVLAGQGVPVGPLRRLAGAVRDLARPVRRVAG